MSKLRPETRRIITCTVLGAVLTPVNRVHDIVMLGDNADLGDLQFAAVSGALYGSFAGFIWAIEHKPARLWFILGIVAGVLISDAYISAVPTGNLFLLDLGPLAGALVGGVLAFSRIRDVRSK